jgi:hypothetical protein
MPQMGPTKIQYKGVDYLVLRENEVLAVETNRYIETADNEELPF